MKPKIAVLIPALARPEYTAMCLESVKQAQDYDNATFYFIDDGGNAEIFNAYSRAQDIVSIHSEPEGLRNSIIEFFRWVLKEGDFDYITKIDNDCLVPKNWLNDLTKIIQDADADIISPNVSETNAAHKYGALHLRQDAFIPSRIVGGLWFMRTEMIEDIYFEQFNSQGIRAAFHIINQIIVEKSPKIGWTDRVTYEDVGYWTGSHPAHIKSKEHALYSAEIKRRITWNVEEQNASDTQESNTILDEKKENGNAD